VSRAEKDGKVTLVGPVSASNATLAERALTRLKCGLPSPSRWALSLRRWLRNRMQSVWLSHGLIGARGSEYTPVSDMAGSLSTSHRCGTFYLASSSPKMANDVRTWGRSCRTGMSARVATGGRQDTMQIAHSVEIDPTATSAARSGNGFGL